MGTLVVNGHGAGFRVTSKSNKRGKSNFTILTKDGSTHVDVDESVDVKFSEESTHPS